LLLKCMDESGHIRDTMKNEIMIRITKTFMHENIHTHTTQLCVV